MGPRTPRGDRPAGEKFGRIRVNPRHRTSRGSLVALAHGASVQTLPALVPGGLWNARREPKFSTMTRRVLSVIAFLAGINGCVASSGDIPNAGSTEGTATPDAALATQVTAIGAADTDGGSDATPAVSCELILDPQARAACAACLANPPQGDGGGETCELVNVGSSLGPTSCCVLPSTDETGTRTCEAIFTYARMAFTGGCPPAE